MTDDGLRSRLVLSQRYANLPIPAPTAPGFYWPSERHLMPTHCAHCGARLLRVSVPTADEPLADVNCLLCTRTACVLQDDSLRERLTPEQWRALPTEQPKRGRPPKPPTEPTRKYHGPPCADCGTPVARHHSIRCQACSLERQRSDARPNRLVALLQHGEPVHRDELKRDLGVNNDAFRKAVGRARDAGYSIVRAEGGCYRLAVRAESTS